MKYKEFKEITKGKRFSVKGYEGMFENKIQKSLEISDIKNIDVNKTIEKKITKIKRNKKVGLLCGGGIDSNYLLVKLGELGYDVNVYSFDTEKNQYELQSVKMLCKGIGFPCKTVQFEDKLIESALDKFYGEYGRYPNDTAAPMVSCLVDQAAKDKCDVVMDGQYADTVLFANPQNIIFELKSIPFLRSAAKESYESLSSLNYWFEILLSSKLRRVFLLSRIIPTDRFVDFIGGLLSRYDASLIFQLVFFECLMYFREADKYKAIALDVCSPFYDYDIFLSSWVGKVRGKKSKRFLYDYVCDYWPEVCPYIVSRSFDM